LADGVDARNGMNTYDMDLIIRPLSAARPNVEIYPPIVVAITTRPERGDVSGVWAFASLTTEDQTESLAPPRNDLLLGRTADSIHPLTDDIDAEGGSIGYAVFSDLKIAEPGTYCLKISLIDMDRYGAVVYRYLV
jgi:hypothetical protein